MPQLGPAPAGVRAARPRPGHAHPQQRQGRAAGGHCVDMGWTVTSRMTSAVKRSIGSTTGFHDHGEGPYWGLLLVESGYYRFHI